MSLSTCAGTKILPVLARIVLFGAFFSAGWGYIFTTVHITQEQRDALEQYGVTVETNQKKPASSSLQPVIHQAAFFQETSAPPADPPKPTTDETASPTPSPPKDVISPAADGSHYEATGYYILSLQMIDAGWGETSIWLAKVVAWVELVGGALILVGLITRLWAVCLAVIIGGTFYVVSIHNTGLFMSNPFHWADSVDAYNAMFAQAALFVLALGVFFTGPGPLSLDAVLFAKDRPKPAADPPPAES